MGDEMELTSDSMVVVPWFSMTEWQEVYKQVYSNDRNLQQKGYERLLVWKARCPFLPAGVECTLGLMQIHLYDQEVWPEISSGRAPAYREKDLRLMYSTAVMRFLNHVSGVAQKSGTLYKMAQRLHIPGWIVNIRHSVAHDMTMAPLSVLREAIDFAFTWINEHYWKNETDVTTNYVTLEDFDNSDKKQIVTKLLSVIEVWQALKLYLQVGYESMSSIPDEKLKSDVYHFMESSLTLGQKPSISKIDQSAVGKLENQATKEVLTVMRDKISHFFIKNKEIFTSDESLTTALLEGETFLLGEDLISLLNIDETDEEGDLPAKLCVLWEDLLRLLQDVNLLPTLLVKLIVLSGKKGESPHRRQMAAIWAREICRGVSKAKEIEHVKEIMTKQWTLKSPISFKSDLGRFNLRNKFQSCHPDLATAISLRPVNLPVVDIDLIKLAMHEPSKWTTFFLPRLLKLAEPALSKTCQANLLKVLKIYTAESIGHPVKVADPFIPFTVEALKASMGEQETDELLSTEMPQMESIHTDAVDSESRENWSRCEDYYEWELCPIGVLPWQRHMALVEFGLPPETVWTTPQTIPAPKKTSQVRPELRLKKINWENMKLQNKNKKFRGELEMPSKKQCTGKSAYRN